MKTSMESTDKVVTLVVNGVDVSVRIWQGVSEAGIPFHAYIVRVVVGIGHDQSEFVSALQKSSAPRAELEAIPFRMVI